MPRIPTFDPSTLDDVTEAKPQFDESLRKKPEAPKVEVTDRFTFQINMMDCTGTLREGTFTNKILSVRERGQVGVLRAQLCGAVPVEALDDATYGLNHMLAHMAFSLTTRPDWAKDLGQLIDDNLLAAIWKEVDSHESRFRGQTKAT